MTDYPYKLDCFEDPPDNRDYIYRDSPHFVPIQMKNVDWSSFMTPVKDQGNLGSCVAFAISAALEVDILRSNNLRYIRENTSIDRKVDLSESWLYYLTKRIDPWPNEEGTSIRYALKILHDYGITSERYAPYGSPLLPSSGRSIQCSLKNRISSYWRIQDFNQFLSALERKPIPIGMLCFREIFDVSSNGIVPMPDDPTNWIGGHAVCAVGYDDDEQLVKFKNSWSSGWGENGYGYLTYEYIYNFVIDVWVFEKSVYSGFERNILSTDFKMLHNFLLSR